SAFDLIDVPNQREAVDDRHVPPQLRPLAEDNADVLHMGDSILPGCAAVDDTFPTIRRQNAAHDFNRAAFTGAVGTDVADHFDVLYGKRNVLQRVYEAVFLMKQGLDRFRK